MDYKELYIDALERAKKNYDVAQDLYNGSQIGVECFKNTLTNIFPELKESDDERIRKELIELISSMHDADPRKKGWIAWLEKQETLCDKCKKEHPSHSCQDITELGRCAVEHEQEPADKTTPKFKVGDWIVQENIGVFKVIEVCESWYEVIDNKDEHYSISFDKEYMCHLWTITDAKDGDVLVNGSNIFIFHFLNDTRLMGYCHVNKDDGRFYDNLGKNECFCLIDAIVTPATKIQRDMLFQKMKEAGYEWDSEKKELKKIEVKTLDPDNVIAWLVANICNFEHYVKLFKKDFGL